MSVLNIIPVIGNILDKVIPDEKAREQAKLEMVKLIQSGDSDIIKSQSENIRSETQGESWLQRNWRPVTMLVLVFTVFNDITLVPYLNLMGVPIPRLDPPQEMWELLKLGLGGYVVGRSGEKMVKFWKNSGNDNKK